MNECVPRSVTWGLLLAWAVHDVEELVTMADWSKRAAAQLSAQYPDVPDGVWQALRTTPVQSAVAIGLVGIPVAAASARGAQTGGRSAWFQTTLAAFGWHAVTHVCQSVLYRGYTPGLITAPAVVAPYTWWAWRRLVAGGVVTPATRSRWVAAIAAPAVVGGSQAIGRCVQKALHRRRSAEQSHHSSDAALT